MAGQFFGVLDAGRSRYVTRDGDAGHGVRVKTRARRTQRWLKRTGRWR